MSKERNYLICGSISLIFFIGYVFFLISAALNTFATNIINNTTQWYILVFIIFVNVFFAIKSSNYFKLFISVLFLVVIVLSFLDNLYSPIDECANFAYINHIISTNTLPTFFDTVDAKYLSEVNSINYGSFVNYEAVQAPLFYVLFAVIGKFIGPAYIRFHVFRIVSLFMVLLVYYFLNKTVNYLKNNRIIALDEETYRLFLCVTIFNPAYIFRASRLNNEILVCVLMVIFLYFAIRCINEGFNKKLYWILSILSVLLFLTKNTSVYVYAVFGVIALMQKKIKKAILPVIVTGGITVPWFIFNLQTYGQLTAMSYHLDYVIPITNPAKNAQDIIDLFFVFLPQTFFLGEESEVLAFGKIWFSCLFILMYAFIGYIIVGIIKDFKKNKFNFERYGIVSRINILCITMIVSCFMVLTVGTIATKIASIRGRYIYGIVIAFVILSVVNCSILFKKNKNILMFIPIMAISVSISSVPFSILNKSFITNNNFGSKITEIELSDLTDENWENGYSRTSNVLLKEVDLDVSANYQLLVGEKISNGKETTVIIGISDIKTIEGISYIWLYTNEYMTPNVESNVIYLEGDIQSIKYNKGQLKVIEELSNIEGKNILQSFKVEESGEIFGVELFFSTYFVPNYSATLNYQILNSNGDTIQSGIKEVTAIADNAAHKIFFNDSFYAEKNQEIKIVLNFDNSEDQHLVIHASEDDEYKNGMLFVDGTEFADFDIGFSLLV